VKIKYSAKVSVTRRYAVEVEAEDSSQARSLAIASAVDSTGGKVTDTGVSLTQLGEPWAYSHGWCGGLPNDVIVVNRSLGNDFSHADIGLLKDRLIAMGLKVVDDWNGAGCSSVSFRCTGRKGTDKFTAEELAALLAPRS